VVSGVQRYLCRSCNRSFRNQRRPSTLNSVLWENFVCNRFTVNQLALKYRRSVNWVRTQLRSYKMPSVKLQPCPMVVVMDCVFFGRTSGYIVVRDPHRQRNVYWSEIAHETISEYQCARDTLERMGFILLAVVTDGKPGLKTLFADIPLQMCQFHQIAIITRYLTRNPKLDAGRELRDIMRTLCNSDESRFSATLTAWHQKWNRFLKERTTDPLSGRWHYTHKRLRSAYRSLNTNLSYLFSYQRHPELDIPNTTNSLDGSFAHLKQLVQIHRGLKSDLKRKIIYYILQNGHRKK